MSDAENNDNYDYSLAAGDDPPTPPLPPLPPLAPVDGDDAPPPGDVLLLPLISLE